MAENRNLLFEEVCAQDFLNFKFGERGYQVSLIVTIEVLGTSNAEM